MTAPVYVMLVRMVELTPEEHEKRIVFVGLRLKGAEYSVPDPQIADASAPDL
jgi:hypothetical protein